MATIENFEQILSWQESRILNQKIGKLIENGTFKSSYRLINQIEGSAGSIMDNMQKDLNVAAIKNLFNFYTLRKLLAENYVRNYTDHWTENILMKVSLKI